MKQSKTPKRWLKKAVLFLLGAVAFFMVFGFFADTPGNKLTPSGHVRNTAQYVTMRDGVRIAVDVWLPANLQEGQRVPALMRTTRYIRAKESGFLRRIALGLGLETVQPMLQFFNDAGYALVLVDARGSGASEGLRIAEISPNETADMGEVADWIVQQSWSSGKVGAFGVSYVGTTSEMLTVSGHPAIKAVAPLFSDFDAYTGLVRPGGVLATQFVKHWGLGNRFSDSNDLCAGQTGLSCFMSRLWYKGIKPVDEDSGDQLRTIIQKRDNYDIEATMQALKNVDDTFAGWKIRDSFPAGYKEQIGASEVPMQVWVSWLDAATVDGALGRYNSFSNPQQLIIAPFNHGGSKNADPFEAVDAPSDPSFLDQYKERIEFLDNFLKTDVPEPIKRHIRYYTMGENRWKTTEVWPPMGVKNQRWYLEAGNKLTREVPKSDEGLDSYQVDYSATTGAANRWLANLSGSRDIVYPDRAEQDEKLLVYDTPAFDHDVEITGVPVVTLQVESTHKEGAFHVYLEDVAPDGRVTYITEGILRGKHRKISTDTPPYYIEGPYHSFRRDDAEALEVGSVTELKIGLITTSVLIRAGHRIRIAVAGHDASVFERVPEQGVPTINIHRNRNTISYVDLPVVPRQR